MSDFLAKPVRKPAMVAAILKAIGPAGPAAAAIIESPGLAPAVGPDQAADA